MTTSAAADPKRDLPDYDGRGNEDADPETWVSWIPRTVFSPLYFFNEYALRRPIGSLLTVAERDHWADAVVSVFEFGLNNKNLIVPTALFDFGLLPSVGLYYSGDDFFAKANSMRVHAATWGPKWIDVTAVDRYQVDKHGQFLTRFEFKRSEDNLFFGIGPSVTSATQSRYGLERTEGTLGYREQLGGESSIGVHSGIHQINYVAGSCCNDPSLDQQIADGALMSPPGYQMNYLAAYEGADLTLDSRTPRPYPGTGVYFHTHGDVHFDLSQPESWIDYGAIVGGAIDLDDRQRTLKLQVSVDFTDQLRGNVTPFNEFSSLGGDLMPGFITGWMLGPSTIAAQVGYTWPIWLWLDGQARVSAGNAFGDHLSGFAFDQLRFSGDIGFTTTGARDQAFEVLFGAGTETIEQGGQITSVRVTFGTRKGF